MNSVKCDVCGQTFKRDDLTTPMSEAERDFLFGHIEWHRQQGTGMTRERFEEVVEGRDWQGLQLAVRDGRRNATMVSLSPGEALAATNMTVAQGAVPLMYSRVWLVPGGGWCQIQLLCGDDGQWRSASAESMLDSLRRHRALG